MWQNRVIQRAIEAKSLVPVKNLLDSDFWPEDFVVRVKPLEEEEATTTSLSQTQQLQQQDPVVDVEAVEGKGFVVKKIDSTLSKAQRLGIIKRVDAAGRTCVVRWMDREVVKGEVVEEGRKRKRWEGEVEEVSFYEIMCHPDFTYSVGTVVLRLPSAQGEGVDTNSSSSNVEAAATEGGEAASEGERGVEEDSWGSEPGKIVSRPPAAKNKKRNAKKKGGYNNNNTQHPQQRQGEMLFQIEEPGDDEEEHGGGGVSKNQRKKAQRRNKNEQGKGEKEKGTANEKEKEKETEQEKERAEEPQKRKPLGPPRHGWVGQITKIKGGQLQILWADKKTSWLDPDAVYALDR